MKGVLKWFETKLSRRSTIVEADERQAPVEESHEPGKDVPMPDIYGFDDAVTQINLEIPDESSPDDNESPGPSESPGRDPYNTA